MAFFEALPPCLIGMEGCATAHYWARELTKLGHEVRLMPAKDVKAYVKRNKNDAADAEAISRRSDAQPCVSWTLNWRRNRPKVWSGRQVARSTMPSGRLQCSAGRNQSFRLAESLLFLVALLGRKAHLECAPKRIGAVQGV
jgi:hypothetical protein